MSDTVTRAIAGHRTPAMTAHYSTVDLAERERAIAGIISLADARKAREAVAAAQPEATPKPSAAQRLERLVKGRT